MAGSTLRVSRKGCERALRIKLVTKRAIGSRMGLWVHPAQWVDVQGMRELDQHRPLLLKERVRNQVASIFRWERRMARGAH